MKNKTIKILSTSIDKGKRIDIFLSEKLKEFTRSYIKKIINSNNVTINNEIINAPSKKISDKDDVRVTFQEEINIKIHPSKKKN